MSIKLHDCIVFDIDETILKTPLNNTEEEMAKSKMFPIIERILTSFDTLHLPYFFFTSRCESLEKCTLKVLGEHRAPNLLMRPIEMNDWKIHTPFEVRKNQIQRLKGMGYTPALVFDDNMEALRAFKIYAPGAILMKADPFNSGVHPTKEDWNKR